VYRGIVQDFKVVIEFGLVIDDIRFKVKVRFRGLSDVDSSSFDIVAPCSYVGNKVIQRSHIVREYALIRSCVSALSSFY
jgi:hypothetical protein